MLVGWSWGGDGVPGGGEGVPGGGEGGGSRAPLMAGADATLARPGQECSGGRERSSGVGGACRRRGHAPAARGDWTALADDGAAAGMLTPLSGNKCTHLSGYWISCLWNNLDSSVSFG